MDSDFNKNSNNYVEIKNLNYTTSEKLKLGNCINLSGNVKIDNSYFYGNSSCENRLLHYNGFGKYTLKLQKSNFDGNYECPFLSIENALNANIETSYFEKGYSSGGIDGGYIKKKREKKLLLIEYIYLLSILNFSHYK